MESQNRFIMILAVSVCVFWAGCQRAPEQRLDLRGKVVSVDKAQRQVTIAHDEIKGYMAAMTMPFSVKEDWALSAFAPGQTIEATLVVKGDRSWIEDIRITQTKEDTQPGEVVNRMPKVGAEVPDFQLLNQDNRRIHLAQYRGRPLVLTFIYTRCPLPDYCPRTSKNFSEIYRALRSRPPSDRKPRLLTISFDTEFDTPAVLKIYAGRYMNPVNFGEWGFATGSPDEIRAITGYFGLIYRKESGQITHSLVTALINSDGKLQRLYLANEWAPSQVLDESK
jgi:protein SCO1